MPNLTVYAVVDHALADRTNASPPGALLKSPFLTPRIRSSIQRDTSKDTLDPHAFPLPTHGPAPNRRAQHQPIHEAELPRRTPTSSSVCD